MQPTGIYTTERTRSGGLALAALLVALLVPADTASAQEVPAEAPAVRPTPLAVGYSAQRLRRTHLRPRSIEEAARTGDDTDPQGRLEIDGLVVDETRTKIGRDFYDAFYTFWQAPRDAYNFTVTIQERPSRGRGSVVSISVHDEVAFQARLTPKFDEIQDTARRAVHFVHRKLRAAPAAPPTY